MGLFSSSRTSNFPWNKLETMEQLHDYLENSSNEPVLLFKHSTRCPVSSMALNDFEREWNTELPVKLVYLDLIAFRPISNEIETLTGVVHQSPQAILVKNNQAIYNASHQSIDAEKISSYL